MRPILRTSHEQRRRSSAHNALSHEQIQHLRNVNQSSMFSVSEIAGIRKPLHYDHRKHSVYDSSLLTPTHRPAEVKQTGSTEHTDNSISRRIQREHSDLAGSRRGSRDVLLSAVDKRTQWRIISMIFIILSVVICVIIFSYYLKQIF